MPNMESIEVGLRITAALDYAKTNGADVRAHYLHTLHALTSELNLSDLTTSELIALKSLLIPAHSRLLTRGRRPPEWDNRILHLVDDSTAIS